MLTAIILINVERHKVNAYSRHDLEAMFAI
jgi:hypothetical protein